VILRGRVVIPIVLAALMLAAGAPNAHALFGRHKSNQPRAMRRTKKNSGPYAYLGARKQKKNTSPYAYLAPKKQKKPKASSHQSNVTGDLFSEKK